MSTDHRATESAAQRDAAVSHDAYENYELPIEGFKGTAEEIERQWYEKCYVGRGDTVKQLTWRAIIMGSIAGRRALADQHLYRSQGRLGVRRRHHGLYSLLRHLDRLLQNETGQIADDHPREQLHAVDRQRRGIFHRRNPGLRVRRVYHAQRSNTSAWLDAGMGLLHRHTRRDHGGADEAADDQCRAAPIPQRDCRRRDTCARCMLPAKRGCAPPGLWVSPDCWRWSALC